jgi:hypothetical protein
MPIDEITCDSIDRAVSIEMRLGGGWSGGFVHPL